MRYPITLTSEQLDLLEDALSYYRLSDMGGGDNADKYDELDDIMKRIDKRRAQAQENEERERQPEIRAWQSFLRGGI